MIAHRLERIVVVPRNGYANRLQAWASAAILGAELDVPVSVLWEPQSIAAAPAEVLFASSFVRRTFIDSQIVVDLLGASHESLPRYLHLDRDRGFVSLAGHDLGEQVFMERLAWDLADDSRPHTLVVVAGGKFHLPGAGDFVRQRRTFYSMLQWSPPIAQRVAELLAGQPPFLGLHIRQTDRATAAPTRRAIQSALDQLGAKTNVHSLFVAADTEQALRQWSTTVVQQGFSPWDSGTSTFDRAEAEAGVGALVDWIVLGRSRALVYSAASSFGEEAAVATGYSSDCLGLSASAARQRWRGLKAEARSAVSYPTRRWKATAHPG